MTDIDDTEDLRCGDDLKDGIDEYIRLNKVYGSFDIADHIRDLVSKGKIIIDDK